MDIRDRAIRYLNNRMCSAHRMKEYLKRKGYEDDDIEKVVEELKEYHYIDDLRYAAAFMEAGFEKGRGIARIRRELREKGVDPDIIASAEESIEHIPDEREVAEDMVKALTEGVDTGSMDRKEREAFKGKIARRLAARGFSSETIYGVINRFM